MRNLQEKGIRGTEFGVYLHIPFCARSCDFCAFYQEAPRREDIRRYLEGVERELDRFPPGAASTVFWGGGTPGLLSAGDLSHLAGLLRERLAGVPVEWTVEMAPSTVKADKIFALREAGVTRLSMGVQSFSPTTLEGLGRHHSVAQVDRAIETIRGCGFDNLNLDLIFSIPGQTPDDWRGDLEAAMARSPEHLSTYCLTFEEDTALYVRMLRGEVKPHGEQADAEFYLGGWHFLAERGYGQYEVSNFAKPGRACLHNINTWRMQEWRGYGPSASSQVGWLRYTHAHSLDEWLDGLASGALKYADYVELDDVMLATDAVIFGLRMNRGIDWAELGERFPKIAWDGLKAGWLRRLEEAGYGAWSQEGRFFLTEEGRLLADAIGVDCMEAFDAAHPQRA